MGKQVKKIVKSEQVKEAEKKLAETQEPVFIDKLELGSGEIYVGNLSDGDKYQLLARRFNEIIVGRRQDTLLLANICVCLQELCKHFDIDIDRKINEI